MQKVIIYINGFNLYVGLKEKGWKCYYWLNLGALAKADNGDMPGVVYDFHKAIEVDPHYAMAYYARGNLHFELGDKVAPILDLHKAGELGMKVAYERVVDV